MTIDAWLVSFLETTPELAKELGAPADFRFYPEQAPQNAAYPHGTYQIIDFPQMNHLDGPSGLAYPRIQIDWWDFSRKKVRDLVELTRNARGGIPQGRKLDGYAGDSHGLRIQRCSLESRTFSAEPSPHGDDKPYRRGSMDFVIHFSEI